MIHRLDNIPLVSKDYQVEQNAIKYLAEAYRYDRILTDGLLWKTQNKQQKTTTGL